VLQYANKVTQHEAPMGCHKAVEFMSASLFLTQYVAQLLVSPLKFPYTF